MFDEQNFEKCKPIINTYIALIMNCLQETKQFTNSDFNTILIKHELIQN